MFSISLFADWVHVGPVSVKTSHTFRIQVIQLPILQLEHVYIRLLLYQQVLLSMITNVWKEGLLDPVLKATQEPLKFSTKWFYLITFKINCWSFVNFLDICQLRLDFDNFDLVETTTGVCTDSLTISGPTGRNPMDLCGTLTGFHGK